MNGVEQGPANIFCKGPWKKYLRSANQTASDVTTEPCGNTIKAIRQCWPGGAQQAEAGVSQVQA